MKCRVVLHAHYLIFPKFSRTLKFHTGSKLKDMNNVIFLWGNIFHEARSKSRSHSTSEKVTKWAEYSHELIHLQLQTWDCFAFPCTFYPPWWLSATKKWSVFRIHLTKLILTALKLRQKLYDIYSQSFWNSCCCKQHIAWGSYWKNAVL